MEIDSDNVAEVEKYAFLLGSAIKNEDTDQFFSIYDTILPKDLPDNQVEEIKTRAREVSELPDAEFDSLVLKARSFSLAPAGTTMTCRDSGKSWVQSGHNELGDDDDDGVTSLGLSGLPPTKANITSLYTTNKVGTPSSELEARKLDDDSGVYNSSKATGSYCGSLSEASDDETRAGTFDYYPAPQVKIRAGVGVSLDYDEAHEVKSDHSSQDLISPRSDISDGIELQTFSSSRRANEDTDDDFNFTRDTYQDDFNTEDESDDEQSYSNRYYNLGYRPLQKEVPSIRTDYQRDEYQPKFASNRHWDEDPAGSLSSLRNKSEVDKGINFPLSDHAPQYSRYGKFYPKKSDRVRIDKNSHKNSSSNDSNHPPFGHGPEQFHNVKTSIQPLISPPANIPVDKLKDMPEGRKLELLQPQEEKRKKKKKKSPKDEAATDENGNPLVTSHPKLSSYKQMREPPSTSAVQPTHTFDTKTYGTFKGAIDQSRAPELEELGHGKARRRKKKVDEPKIKSEDVENYKGDLSMEELLSFIGAENVSNKKNKHKLSPAASATNEDIPNKTQKSTKKNKDKKQKSSPAALANDSPELKKSESAQSITLDSPTGSETTMGNSTVKSDLDQVTNGENDALYSNKETLALLNEQATKIEVNRQEIHVAAFSESAGDNCKIVNSKEIYKDKDKPDKISKNNRRETETSASSAENDGKKIEKDKPDKVFKAEKFELTGSKSEETIKMDKNSANTVKQKNAKNKKSKPSSPTVKVESELGDTESVPASVVNEFENSKFIFTDLVVPSVPTEDEFQVVGKKKKKITPSIEPPYRNNVLHTGAVNGKARRHEEKRPSERPQSASNKTPVYVNHVHTLDMDTRVRDLSPSAFPALGNSKGRQSSGEEGRRNSTGDVPVPSGLKSQDDSDLESVKSLPATQVGQGAEATLSPRLSYAKMAAHLQLKPADCMDGDHLSVTEECPRPVAGEDGRDPKKAVWKGSPTERRHSIGSSPEVGSKSCACPSSTTASTKAGSSEHMIADAALKAGLPNSVVSRKVNPWGKGNEGLIPETQKTETTAEEEGVLEKTDSPSEMSRISCNSETKVLSSNSEMTSSSSAKYASSSSVSQMQPAANAAKLSGSHSNQTDSSSGEPDLQNSIHFNNRNCSINNTSVHKHESNKTKFSNGRKQKSVIFLDKRMEETSASLGISFGFELDSLEASESSIPTDVSKLEQTRDASELQFGGKPVHYADHSVIVNKAISEPVDIGMNDCPRPSIHNPSTPSVISDSVGPGKQSMKPPASSEPRPDLAAKANLVRKNGIVTNAQTQGHGHHLSHSCKATGSTSSLADASPPVDSASSPVASTHSSADNLASYEQSPQCSRFSVPDRDIEGELIYFGERVETLKKSLLGSSSINGPAKYCGLVGFVSELEHRGNFNLNEVASFLTREWDRTLKQRDKEPDNVRMFVE